MYYNHFNNRSSFRETKKLYVATESGERNVAKGTMLTSVHDIGLRICNVGRCISRVQLHEGGKTGARSLRGNFLSCGRVLSRLLHYEAAPRATRSNASVCMQARPTTSAELKSGCCFDGKRTGHRVFRFS